MRSATRIPIGVGDLGHTTCKEFEPFLAADAFDIAQPDLTVFGGFTEALRLVHMLTGSGRRIVPHAYNTDLTIAANLHFLATQEGAGTGGVLDQPLAPQARASSAASGRSATTERSRSPPALASA